MQEIEDCAGQYRPRMLQNNQVFRVLMEAGLPTDAVRRGQMCAGEGETSNTLKRLEPIGSLSEERLRELADLCYSKA